MKRRDLFKLSGLGATLAFLAHKVYYSDPGDNQNLVANNLNLPVSLTATQKIFFFSN